MIGPSILWLYGAPWLMAGVLGVLGAVLGSFIATLVLRWPQERSVMSGRSHCDGCDAVLQPFDLVPLVSAILIGGRCRHCDGAINPLHWQIEALAMLIGVSAGLLITGPGAIIAALFGWLLLPLAVLDLTDFWLPDRLTAFLAIAGLAVGLTGMEPPLIERVIGGAGGFLALWSIGKGYQLLRGREGLGGGDPKLLGAIGLWLGWRLLPIVLVLACMIGFGALLFGYVTGRRAAWNDRLPLGTLMAVAAYPAEIIMLLPLA